MDRGSAGKIWMPGQGTGEGLEIQATRASPPAEGPSGRPGTRAPTSRACSRTRCQAPVQLAPPAEERRQIAEADATLADLGPGPKDGDAGLVRGLHGKDGQVG